MIGEAIDRIVTFGTPLYVFGKDLIEHLIKHPELQAVATEKLIGVTKKGRTRADELFFIASLITLHGVSAKNKQLFLQKHCELLHYKTEGKSPEELTELKKKEQLAKGLIFLIAEDKTAVDENKSKRFQYAREIWYAIFLGIDDLPDDTTKLQVLEERIVHFGKNHQDGMTLHEAIEKIQEIYNLCEPTIQTSAQIVGDAISSGVNLINRQYDENLLRQEEQGTRSWREKLHPRNIWRWYIDQF
ncbi:MAG TPA: hypothetical protein PLK35_02475 [Candidatus Moranbacteria bacterium]|nr:hypothetical protein [Candidatus Moranbacteria bacterium]